MITKAISTKKETILYTGFSINKILVSKKESYGTKNSLKYFIGYNDGNVIKPV